MIEQDVECVEERSANLVAVLRGAAHPAHQAIGAFGRDAQCRRLESQAARDLVPEKHLRTLEYAIRPRIDRKSNVLGKRVSVVVDIGVRGIIKKKTRKYST